MDRLYTRQADREIDKQTDGWTEKQTYVGTNGQKDGRIDRQTDIFSSMGILMSRQTERETEAV